MILIAHFCRRQKIKTKQIKNSRKANVEEGEGEEEASLWWKVSHVVFEVMLFAFIKKVCQTVSYLKMKYFYFLKIPKIAGSLYRENTQVTSIYQQKLLEKRRKRLKKWVRKNNSIKNEVRPLAP